MDKFKQDLVKLIIENPNSEILFMVRNDDLYDDWSSTCFEASTNYSCCYIDELVLYDGKWVDKEDLMDYLSNELEDEYCDLLDDEYFEAIEDKVNKEYEFKRFIVISV